MKKHASFGLAALVIAAPLWAQAPKLDANGDGSVTLEELQTSRLDAIRQRFAALDADGDGNVTLEEFQAGPLAALQHRFAALDADRDGRLSAAELGDRTSRRRSRIDTDGDGAWSFAELQAVRPDLTVERFNELDHNGDGLITRDERPSRGGPGGRRWAGPDAAGGETPAGR